MSSGSIFSASAIAAVATSSQPPRPAFDYPKVDRNSRLAQALDHALEVGRVLVGQNLPAVLDRVARVDPQHLLPLDLRMVRAAQMTVTGGEQHPTDVGLRVTHQPAPERRFGIRIPAQAEMALGQKMQVRVRVVGIELHRPLQLAKGLL